MVLILRTTGINHEYEINIGAGSVLSILISKIHKHINGCKKGWRERREKKGDVSKLAHPLFFRVRSKCRMSLFSRVSKS